MKICFLLSTFSYDGIKRSVVHFANAMHDLGHEVWVGVLHEWPGKLSLRSELRVPSERVVSWDGLGQGRREWAIYHFFKHQCFDVVHANTVKMNHLGRWIGWAARVPCVLASEDNLCLNRSWKTRAEDRFLAKLGDGVVMISRKVAESFLEVEKLPPEKVHTIYYGLPITTFDEARRKPLDGAAKRAELKIGPGPLVVCAARLHFSKALDVLVRAAKLVVEQVPNAQFVLAGDGDERLRLEKLIEELGLDGIFHLVGPRSDVYEIFQIADIVTLSSLWEGLGFSLMEAMALGKPVVGTDVPGINEIIEDGRNGLLVPSKSAEALAAAISKLLLDKALANRMGEQSLLVVREKFDVVKNAGELLELYQKILRRKAA